MIDVLYHSIGDAYFDKSLEFLVTFQDIFIKLDSHAVLATEGTIGNLHSFAHLSIELEMKNKT